VGIGEDQHIGRVIARPLAIAMHFARAAHADFALVGGNRPFDPVFQGRTTRRKDRSPARIQISVLVAIEQKRSAAHAYTAQASPWFLLVKGALRASVGQAHERAIVPPATIGSRRPC
jgi:hypothetical protein